MKKIIIVLLCGLLMMTGCERSMLSHTTKKQMNKLVKNAIKESFELYEVIDEEDTEDRITYVYYLENRDIYFRAISEINEVFVDASSFGFTHDKTIYYEVDIASDEDNLSLREEKLEEYGLWEDQSIYDYSVDFYTCIENYDQLTDLTLFLIDMDYIYDFDEDDMGKLERVENHLGLLEDGEWHKTFATIEYAPYGDKKLSYEQLYPYLEEQYVLMIKNYDLYDSTIPDDVYDKYTEEEEER